MNRQKRSEKKKGSLIDIINPEEIRKSTEVNYN